MTDTLKIYDALKPILNNELKNYIIPGLSSFLVGGDSFGKVRLFSASRSAKDFITPHSHRFDFTGFVLKGCVHNTIYERGEYGDQWCVSSIGQVCGRDGINKYSHVREEEPTSFIHRTEYFSKESVYHMKFNEIHSIVFEKDTVVLVFEGTTVTDVSYMIEPWVDGKVIPTFKTEPWMFEK